MTPSADSPTSNPVPGPLRQTHPINAVAVSVTNTDLAVTTNARTTLRRAADDAWGIRQRLAHRSYRAVEAAVQQVRRDLGSRETGWPAANVDVHTRQHNSTRSPRLRRTSRRSGSRPDGTADGGGTPHCEWVRARAGTHHPLRPAVRVESWRRLDTSQSGTSISEIADVAWFDPTELLGVRERRAETPRSSGWRRMPHSSPRRASLKTSTPLSSLSRPRRSR